MGTFGGLGDLFHSVGKFFGFVPGSTVVHGTREPTGTSAVPFHTTAPGTTPSGGGGRDTDGTLTPIPSTGPSPFGSPPAEAEAFVATTDSGANAALGAWDDPTPDDLLGGYDAQVPEVPEVTEVAGPDSGFPGGRDGDGGRIEWHGPGRDVVDVAGPDPGRDTTLDGSVFQRETHPFQHDTGTGTGSDDGGGQTAASSEADDPPMFSAADDEDASGGGHEAHYRSGAEEHTDQQDWHDHTDTTG